MNERDLHFVVINLQLFTATTTNTKLGQVRLNAAFACDDNGALKKGQIISAHLKKRLCRFCI